jgi:isopropylmalate/homocitrate/citramalate synthase
MRKCGPGPVHIVTRSSGDTFNEAWVRARPLSPLRLHMQEHDLIHDWNLQKGAFDWSACRVELNDETLRDGLQCPSVTDPAVDDKLRLLHLMVDLGIAAADIGLPGAGARSRADTLALALEIARSGMPLEPNCAARTVVSDVEPVARISQAAGIPIEAATFIGSSPIRRYAEDWTLDRMLKVSEEAVTFAVREGLPVMFVTEDTTRADPETLKALYGNAIRWGARRLCLADTVGHATPDGVRALVRFVRSEIVEPSGEAVKLDWHGHRDRGLGLANCLAAIEAGVDRVHGTALGIGERVGNAEMDLLLINLSLLGAHRHDLSRLPEYSLLASRACGVPIPPSYPVLGEDAFRTGTGVHAAAIIKARRKGDAWLADRIYSGVPAGDFGLSQRIEISPVSGLSNVRYWLEENGFNSDDQELCQYIFDAAKRLSRVLRDDELRSMVRDFQQSPADA